ncbi:hypothetical protein MY11210_007232 [Beauveria gryllotalpidicola]
MTLASTCVWNSEISSHLNTTPSTLDDLRQRALAMALFWLSGPAWATKIVRYDKDKITRVVGVESNPHFRPEIEAQAGLGDVLERHGVGAAGVDTAGGWENFSQTVRG